MDSDGGRYAATDAEAMALAIDAARVGIGEGQSPFGCCVVKDGLVLATDHNRVWSDTDATAHAEVLAIRDACRKLGSIDLTGCTLYATCEPCPMCLSAAHWARVSRVVFGARIEDATAAGFNEMAVPARRLSQMAGDDMELVPGVMEEECRLLFLEWAEGGGKSY